MKKHKILLVVSVLLLAALACTASSNQNNSNNTANNSQSNNDVDFQATEAALARREAQIAATQSAVETAASRPTRAPATEPRPTLAIAPTTASQPDSYYTEFDSLGEWNVYTQTNQTRYNFESRAAGLFITVPDAHDYLYSYLDFWGADVYIEAEVELVGGTNYTYIELYCRSSSEGEYTFFLDTGGYWQIGMWDFTGGGYTELGYGGTTAINAGRNVNLMQVWCFEDRLIFYINEIAVAEVSDNTFSEGIVGFGVTTWDNPYTEVYFHYFYVEIQ